MANEHIGRLKQFGLAKQSVAGTPVSPTMWIPCKALDMKPVFEKIRDESCLGVIEEFSGDEHISKKSAEVTGEAYARDESIGHFIKAALGKETLCDLITITGAGGGTPAKKDSITSTTGTWTGTIHKLIVVGGTTYYAVETLTGTIGDLDAKTDLTNGTWTGGTVEQSDFTAAKVHFFERLNTNSTHPIYSLYTESPVAGRETSDASMESLDMEFVPGVYPNVKFAYKGINLVDGGALTPAITTENLFLPSQPIVKFAANELALNAASATALRRFKLSYAKNLNPEETLGQSGAISGFNNQQFGMSGDMEAVFNSEVLQNYHLDNSFKAARIEIINDAVTAIVDTSDDIFPSLYIDFAKAFFMDWGKSDDLNGITSQTLGYTPHYDKDDALFSTEILLINIRATEY